MITTLTISGMRSAHCGRAVFTALGGVEGISAADVRMGEATVEHDGRVTLDALRAAVTLAGYEVTTAREDRRRLSVRG